MFEQSREQANAKMQLMAALTKSFCTVGLFVNDTMCC